MNSQLPPPMTDEESGEPTGQSEGAEGELSFSAQDYPEIANLKAGETGKLTCNFSVKESDGEAVTVEIDPGTCEFEMGNKADRSLNQMTKKNAPPAGATEDKGLADEF